MTTPMPALYIGHGAPPLLDDPIWSGQLAAWAKDLPRPKAILIVSRALGVGAGEPDGERRTAGLRLRRVRAEVLPDDLRDP